MPRYHFDDMDEMADDYEMGDAEDDMYEEFQERVLGDSDSDDEEYGPLNGRANDISSSQARKGKDIQGIPWGTLSITREKYRQTRLEQYKNYENVPNSGEESEKDCQPTDKGGMYYEFQRNTRSVKSTILHFQLRNLIWATSKHDVYLMSHYSVLHWSALNGEKYEVMNVSGHIAPCEKHPGSLLEGFSQTQVSTLAVKDKLLVAGGFQGELICKAGTELAVVLTIVGGEGGMGKEEAKILFLSFISIKKVKVALVSKFIRWTSSSEASMCGRNAGVQLDRAGVQLDRFLDREGISFCCRTTYDDNAITNALEIYDSSSGAVHFMSSNNDCGVRDFDLEKFQLCKHFRFPWPVNHTSLSPNGKLLAIVGDDPDAILADAHTGKITHAVHGHLDFSFASAWHPDGQTFATGNQDKTCRIWDIRNLSKSVAVLRGNLGAIRSIRFTSDGQFLAMAEPADFVHVFDVGSGYRKQQELDFFGEISGMSFSPDTEALFIGVWDRTYGSLLQYSRRRNYSYLDSML